MGRRSTSSTKSGKFMNPTDQARKEARKRELKKNKKQRMMVRAAVLKMKDPRQIIKDMEKLDEMEFNPVQQPLLNEKVLRDKRKKLRETFERIVRLYERENPETYKELRKVEVDYETKRGQLALYFHSVKNAESVEVDSIPLPDMPHAPSSILIQDIPLPGAQPPSILKKSSALGKASAVSSAALAGVPRLPSGRKPPGPPPGPPPPQILLLYGNTRRTDDAGGSDTEMFDIGGRDTDSESDADDDSDSQDDSGGERDDTDADMRMMTDRHDDREDERDRADKHTGRSVRFADMPSTREKRKNRVMKKNKTITPLQAMMLRMAGQSVPEEEDGDYFTDSDHSDGEDEAVDAESAHSLANPRLPAPSALMAAQQPPPHMQAPPITGPPPMRPPGPPSGPPPGPPPGAPPFMRPPGMPATLRGPIPRMLPPGPPPGRPPGPPPGPPPGLPPGPPPRGPPPRLPPPAPPGMPPPPPPPRTGPPRMAPPLSLFPPPLNPNVLSAPPSIVPRQKPPTVSVSSGESSQSASTRPPALQMPPPPGTAPLLAPTIEKRANISGPSSAQPGTATISAKPQIINPKTEVTRFVPTALRVRRDRTGTVDKMAGRREDEREQPKQVSIKPTQSAPHNMKTKDQMYEAFMREMEGLL
ncbi:WW domain-binding protein 11-like [Xyrauchen texanus]|uniref:WW domain-binding protein 11-like n=1 Tax=Xyrauchen texanus TaxID=154827 RepID=UPI002242BCA0|nr:WW domain-binding protein 11-like [Xyrauchen texanus]